MVHLHNHVESIRIGPIVVHLTEELSENPSVTSFHIARLLTTQVAHCGTDFATWHSKGKLANHWLFPLLPPHLACELSPPFDGAPFVPHH